MQSVATEQVCPVPHLVEQLPPQSTSVSVPFLTPSLQVAIAHRPFEQTPLEQSLLAVHTLLALHRLQLVWPPQSTSLSPPFLTLSLQAGAAQIPPVQTPLCQSPPITQFSPVSHFDAQLPPQSTSVSFPFLMESEQLTFWQ